MAMACGNLKRSLDLELLTQSPSKRFRFPSYGKSGGNSQSLGGSNDGSISTMPSNRYAKENTKHSPYLECALPKMSPDKMANNLRNGLKRLRKCKELSITSSALERMQDSESSEMDAKKPRLMCDPNENALFTFKQVQLICEDMMKEREDQLRERYESVLTNKLAEQYDVFVKFTHDQIHRCYQAPPSYLS